MNEREMVEFVFDKLIEQGKRSVRDGLCVYRFDDGCRCAAGWLIPDNKYSPDLEQCVCWEDDMANFDEAHKERARKVVKILEEQGYNPYSVRYLQKIHDNDEFSIDFVSRMKENRARILKELDSGKTLSQLHKSLQVGE